MSESEPSKRYVPDLRLKDYKGSPELVKRVVDKAFEFYETVVIDNEELIAENEDLENKYSLVITENATLKERVHHMRTAIAYQIFLGFFGGVLVTFGIGIIYSSQDHSSPLGWLLFFSGFGIGLAAFIYSRFFSRKSQEDQTHGDEE